MWHDDCGGRVMFIDGGHVCDCGAQDTITDEEIPERVAGMWANGWDRPEAEETYVLLFRQLVTLGVDPLHVYRILDEARKAVASEYGD